VGSFRIKQLARLLDIRVIDSSAATSSHSEHFSFDGIHANAGGAKHVAEVVYTALAPAILKSAKPVREIDMHAADIELLALAERLFTALEADDVDAVTACYGANARIWHNFDQVEMTCEQHAAGLRDYFTRFPGRKYLQIRRGIVAPDRLIQQHVLRLVRADGRTFDWPGCIVLQIRDQAIQVLEEYVDLASFLRKMS
jgi:ketosteroid isomerase-like protein